MYVSMLISLLFQIELRISCSSRNIEIKNNFGKEVKLLFLNQQKHHQREVRIIVFSNSIFSKSWISRFQTKNKSSASSAGGLFTKCQPSINVFSFCFSTPGEINGFLKKDKLKTLYRESIYVCSTYTSLQLTLCRYLCVVTMKMACIQYTILFKLICEKLG